MRYVSVVLSTFNEINTGYIEKSLTQLCRFENFEIIVVDGGSYDGTLELLKKFPIRLIHSEAKTRSGRLNQGIAVASHLWVLLHHPRSLLDLDALSALIDSPELPQWGAFTHQFDFKHPLLRFTSWYSNYIRGDLKHIYYLDHCIFFNKNLLADQIGPIVPDIAIFEDTALCLKLRKLAKPRRLPPVSTTSSIRFLKNGILHQSLLNQIVKLAYLLKLPDTTINKIYEKGLSLNTKY